MNTRRWPSMCARSGRQGCELEGAAAVAGMSSCRNQHLVTKEGRLFQAEEGLRCQSHPDATYVGLRPVEPEIAEDTGKRQLVEVPPEETLSQVRELSDQMMQP